MSKERQGQFLKFLKGKAHLLEDLIEPYTIDLAKFA